MRRTEHLFMAFLDKIEPNFGLAAILASGKLCFQGWMVMRFDTKRRFG